MNLHASIAGDPANPTALGGVMRSGPATEGAYVGETLAGKRHGRGQLSWPSGLLCYEGEWQHGQRWGRGIEHDRHGHVVYEGEWRGDMREGTGTIMLAGLVHYRGSFHADMCHGRGTGFEHGEVTYDGEWRNGLFHGVGRFMCCDELLLSASIRPQYEGDFRFGMRHGRGTYTSQTGSEMVTWEGDWYRDDFTGYGKRQSNFATTSVGMWRKGEMHGYGMRLFDNGSIRFAGELAFGKRAGPGVQFSYVCIGDEVPGSTYLGQWLNDQRHGAGTLWSLDTREYDGGWRAGKRHGVGVLYYADGSERYRGGFCADKRNGQGVHHLLETRCDATYDGAWADDKPSGTGTLTVRRGAARAWLACAEPMTADAQLLDAIEATKSIPGSIEWNDSMAAARRHLFAHPGAAKACLTTLMRCLARETRLKHKLMELMQDWFESNFDFDFDSESESESDSGSETESESDSDSEHANKPRCAAEHADKPTCAAEHANKANCAAEHADRSRCAAADDAWTYQGQWQRGTRHGVGRMDHDGQVVYEGEWQHNLFHGRGRLSQCADVLPCGWRDGAPLGVLAYEGQFSAGQRAGKGTAQLAGGAEYAGAWLNGQPHGVGKLCYGPVQGNANDCSAGGVPTYVGRVAHGLPAGYGTLLFDGQVWYTGEFSDGRFHGHGQLRMDAAALLAAGIRHARVCQYVGGFRRGQRSGHGVLTDSHGLVLHDGRWQHGSFVQPEAATSSAAAAAEAAIVSAKLLAKAELDARRLARDRERLALRRAHALRASTAEESRAQDPPHEAEPDPVEAAAERVELNRRSRRAALQAARVRDALQADRLSQSQQTDAGAQRSAQPLFASPAGEAEQAARAAESAAAGRRRAAKQAKPARPAKKSMDEFNSRKK